MKNRLLGGTALAILFATPAIGADMRAPVYKAPPPVAAVPFNWSGAYLGGHCGGAWTGTRTSNLEDSSIRLLFRLNGSGAFCGGQLGYNFQQGQWLFGIEGELGGVWLKAKDSATLPSETRVSQVKYGWIGTLTGRLGLTFDRSLFYVKGGAAFANIKNSTFQIEIPSGDQNAEDVSSVSRTRSGWALGGGLEFAVGQDWSWKLEYLHMDFGRQTTTTPDGDAFHHRNRIDTVKVGLNYRWGSGPLVARY